MSYTIQSGLYMFTSSLKKMKILATYNRKISEGIISAKKFARSAKRRLYLYATSIIQWFRKYLSPKIGTLHHHPPKELKIPKRYAKRKVLHNPYLISVVTPSYNTGHFIKKTIQSVLAQRYQPLEYFVQDCASSDDTPNILATFSQPGFSWISEPDDGQTDAINRGFARTNGDILCYLNADDILLPGSLNYVANYFSKHENVDVIYGHRILIDENNYEIGRWVLPPHDNEVLKWADYIPQETLFWRRHIWGKLTQD